MVRGESRVLPVRPFYTSPNGNSELRVIGDGQQLNLTELDASNWPVIGAARIDGVGNTVTLNANVVAATTTDTGLLRVKSSPDNVVDFGTG